MHEVVCLFAAPIPVGHRVECTWFTEQVQGLLSGAQMVTWEYEPMVKDLVTGIEYSSHRAFESGGMKMRRQPLAISDHANPAIRTAHQLRGVVRRCRVISCTGFEHDPIQTHLDVEPVAAPRPWGPP